MKKMWKELTACLLVVSMVFGNSALVVNAEEIGKEEESVPVAEQEMISEEEEILISDNTEEIEEESEEELEEQETDEQKQINMMAEESIQQEETPEADQTEEENGIMPMTADDPNWFIFLYSDYDSPYWAESTYFGKKQTLTAVVEPADDADSGNKEEIEGAEFEWSLGTTDFDGEPDDKADIEVLTIEPNGDKCVVTSNNKPGYAYIKVTLKKDGEEICSDITPIHVYEKVTSYKLSASDIYAHPGDRISVNDFAPQLKQYVNDKLVGSVTPTSYEFLFDADEDKKYLDYGSDGTAFTIKSNILNGINMWEYGIYMEASYGDRGAGCSASVLIHNLTWSDWTTTSAATVFAPAKQIRKCTECGKSEERTVGSKLKAVAETNMPSVTLLTNQSTKKLRVTFAGGDSVTDWKSSNTGIAAVSGKADGTCTIKAGTKAGTATLTIKTAAGAEKTIDIKVQKPTIKTNASSITLKTKQSTKQFKVTYESGDSIASWKSSNTKIATVSGKANGTCTIKAGAKTGTATLTIKTAAGAVKTVKVKVQKNKVPTKSIKQVPKKITIKKGQTYKLTPSIQPITSTDKAKYSSANKKIATVTGKGVIKGKKAGKTKITVTAGKKKVTCTVVVKK